MRTRTSTAPDDAKRVTMQVSTVGIVCNAALTVFKLVAGIVAHSSAIVADAVHSASDILGSLIVMIGAIFSHKAADASHPYGHEKLECIASILLGNILVLVGAAIGYAGVMKIVRGETLAAPGVLALIAAVVSIGVKEGLYWYTIAAAKRIRSVSLKAEAWHHRSDALSSIGSFAGVMLELLWCFARHGYLESRSGLVWGPFNMLYGVGAASLSIILYRFRNRGKWLSFLGGFVVGSAVEYVCSWLQEVLFGSRSWDYSRVPFNINGRICLLYSLFWGALGILWIKDIYPLMAKWILKLPNRAGKILTWVLSIFLAVNCLVSAAAVYRWSERLHDEPPKTWIGSVMDARFPNERMERIYANMNFGDSE